MNQQKQKGSPDMKSHIFQFERRIFQGAMSGYIGAIAMSVLYSSYIGAMFELYIGLIQELDWSNIGAI